MCEWFLDRYCTCCIRCWHPTPTPTPTPTPFALHSAFMEFFSTVKEGISCIEHCVWVGVCVCLCCVCVGWCVCVVCVCVSPGDVYVDQLMSCRKQKTLFFNMCIAEENFSKTATVPSKYNTRWAVDHVAEQINTISAVTAMMCRC